MKLKTIRIDKAYGKNKFSFYITKATEDVYVNGKTEPYPLGFYHFNPDKVTDKEAFIKLVTCMEKAHNDKIKEIKLSLSSLITFKESVINGKNSL